jgi:undecaprenyl-diphosphatase
LTLLEAIILGIVQGLTEFLPVSSSGHIEIAQAILGMQSLSEREEALSVFLHGGTALSTIFVFRKDISELVSGIFSASWNREKKFAILIVISMIPAGLAGLFLDEYISGLFDGKVGLTGAMLLVTSVLLWFADKAGSPQMNVNPGKALIIGIAQMIAILPGISRSGATISTSLLLRIDRNQAARFSFLMVVPLIVGKMLLDLMDEAESGFAAWDGIMIPLAAGFGASFLTGILACRWMLLLVQRSQLRYFGLYCLIVGFIALFWTFF